MTRILIFFLPLSNLSPFICYRNVTQHSINNFKQMEENTKSLLINYRAVIVTGIIAFILSLIWYSPFVFGKIWMELRHAPIQSSPSWTMIFAPLRELIASYVVALLIT